MTTLTHHEPLTPGQELVQGAYESGIQPMRQPRRKSLQEAYGFDDVAIVPGVLTINPELTDVSTELAGQRLEIPILASAMDAVVGSALRCRGWPTWRHGCTQPGRVAVPLRRPGGGAAGGRG